MLFLLSRPRYATPGHCNLRKLFEWVRFYLPHVSQVFVLGNLLTFNIAFVQYVSNENAFHQKNNINDKKLQNVIQQITKCDISALGVVTGVSFNPVKRNLL